MYCCCRESPDSEEGTSLLRNTPENWFSLSFVYVLFSYCHLFLSMYVCVDTFRFVLFNFSCSSHGAGLSLLVCPPKRLRYLHLAPHVLLFLILGLPAGDSHLGFVPLLSYYSGVTRTPTLLNV